MADVRSPDYDEKRDEAPFPPPPPPADPSGRLSPTLEPNEVRAATTRPPTGTVLAISLIGVVILMVLAYFFFFPTTADPLAPEQTAPATVSPAPPSDIAPSAATDG